MFARMLVATALIVSSGAAFASDASYDQRQIREGNVTLVEGGLGLRARNEKVAKVEKVTPSTNVGHMVACSCRK